MFGIRKVTIDTQIWQKKKKKKNTNQNQKKKNRPSCVAREFVGSHEGKRRKTEKKKCFHFLDLLGVIKSVQYHGLDISLEYIHP